ncbi:MAG: phosphopyruvate hydratase, partial [Alphaproteobacteria bacterium]
MGSIVSLFAVERFDSRGWPTVAVSVELESGARGYSLVPAGLSRGRDEARELRDGGERLGGRGVREAVRLVRGEIFSVLSGLEAGDQALVDSHLVALDGSSDRSRLGANTILGVSIAVARAAAAELGEPLYRYLGGVGARTLPVPMFNLINGGAHANNGLDFQEFMVLPVGYGSFADALEAGVEIFHLLRAFLSEGGWSTAVGDEGGFAPDFATSVEAIEAILGAIEKSGAKAGRDVWLGFDCAASCFAARGERGEERIYTFEGKSFSSGEWVEHLTALCGSYPVLSIEDPAAEDDVETWSTVTRALGSGVQLVGDDNLVTRAGRVVEAARAGHGNAVLVKPNQVGTLTETFETLSAATRVGFARIISHRSGETEDTTIADLAVAANTGQIKCGAPSRGERTAKYNRLLDIADDLGVAAVYGGTSAFGVLA